MEEEKESNLKSFIPLKHMHLWELIAEISLAVIVIVSLFEIAHYVFKVYFSPQMLIALELIDYAAILVLGIDLLHHFSTSENKPKFLQNKFIYIVSFIPYLIFTKTMGALYLLKPILTGIAKIIKLVFHADEIKDRAEKIKEKVNGTEKKRK